MVIPPGAKVSTAYVPIEQIILANRERMAIGDVEKAMQRLMSCAPASPWPCPVGEWREDRFAVFDGRHAVVAATMLGNSHILVAWVDGQA